MSEWDYLYRSLTELWEGLLSFGVIIAAFYALWLVFSAIYRAFK
jgi:hypothetical protein